MTPAVLPAAHVQVPLAPGLRALPVRTAPTTRPPPRARARARTPRSAARTTTRPARIDRRRAALEHAGLADVGGFFDGFGDKRALLRLLCGVGHAGEMFTSAAPQDPLFWVLHGFADRYVTFKRALAARNATALDETWGYDHVPQLPSDTRGVRLVGRGGRRRRPADLRARRDVPGPPRVRRAADGQLHRPRRDVHEPPVLGLHRALAAAAQIPRRLRRVLELARLLGRHRAPLLRARARALVSVRVRAVRAHDRGRHRAGKCARRREDAAAAAVDGGGDARGRSRGALPPRILAARGLGRGAVIVAERRGGRGDDATGVVTVLGGDRDGGGGGGGPINEPATNDALAARRERARRRVARAQTRARASVRGSRRAAPTRRPRARRRGAPPTEETRAWPTRRRRARRARTRNRTRTARRAAPRRSRPSASRPARAARARGTRRRRPPRCRTPRSGPPRSRAGRRAARARAASRRRRARRGVGATRRSVTPAHVEGAARRGLVVDEQSARRSLGGGDARGLGDRLARPRPSLRAAIARADAGADAGGGGGGAAPASRARARRSHSHGARSPASAGSDAAHSAQRLRGCVGTARDHATRSASSVLVREGGAWPRSRPAPPPRPRRA